MPRTLAHIQDALLIIRCQDGEAAALEELIIRWRKRLQAHAWRLTHDVDAAADVSQEAWIAIVRGLHRLTDPSHFRPWAYRIVTHKCADWMRSQQRHRRITRHAVDSERAGVRSDPHGQSDVLRLRACLANVRPETRAILSMHYLDQMNVNQIAIALDIPVGTVKSRLFNARKELKTEFERHKS